MDKKHIKQFVESFKHKKNRTLVIIDYGNVEKWKYSLPWKVDIRKLGQLVKHFSQGNKSLRRFYYGSDFGKSEKNDILVPWSEAIITTAQMNKFEIVTKRVKYIRDNTNKHGYSKKCDLDVDMAVDIIRLRDAYDTIILFSGDGDIMCAINYVVEEYGKECYVFGARDHIGREVFDAKQQRTVKEVLFVESFEYRLKK